jgi:hypothetical protein
VTCPCITELLSDKTLGLGRAVELIERKKKLTWDLQKDDLFRHSRRRTSASRKRRASRRKRKENRE